MAVGDGDGLLVHGAQYSLLKDNDGVAEIDGVATGISTPKSILCKYFNF